MTYRMPWNVKWALLTNRLSEELDPEIVLPKLKLAFNLGSPNTVRELFDNLNQKAVFTGTIADESGVKLLRVLYLAKCENMSVVIELKKALETYFPDKMASFTV